MTDDIHELTSNHLRGLCGCFAIHPELVAVFEHFAGVPCAIVGSATKNYDTANDVDVLVPSTFDMKAYLRRRGYRYLGGFDDRDGNHVRRSDHFRIHGVEKPVQILQWDTVETFNQYPHCVLLRDGTKLHDRVFFQKEKK